jgi:hypothetical protein
MNSSPPTSATYAAAKTGPSSTFAARAVPIESALVEGVEQYLDSRATRFPATAKQRSPGRDIPQPSLASGTGQAHRTAGRLTQWALASSSKPFHAGVPEPVREFAILDHPDETGA